MRKLKNTLTFACLMTGMLILNPLAGPNDMHIGGGLDFAFPFGDFGDLAGPGFGIAACYKYEIIENIILSGHTGFTTWIDEEQNLGFMKVEWSINAIPIKVGGRYAIPAGIGRFYGGAETGLHIFLMETKVTGTFWGVTTTSSDSDYEPEFSFAPVVGYDITVADRLSLDFSARLELVQDDLDYFGIRALIHYQLN